MPSISFVAPLQKFDRHGEKSGWIYLEISATLAEVLYPGRRKSFRVKGKLDQHPITAVALLPMGAGNFILPVNAALRKGIAKGVGAMVQLQLSVDEKDYNLNQDFTTCLSDDPRALAFFRSLAPSHQRYFSKWVDEAKTEPTKVKRIAQALYGLSHHMDFGQMIRFHKGKT